MNEISEMVMLKANLMGGMNEYIKELGDEDIWEVWIEVFPDDCTEDDLMEMAQDDKVWGWVVDCFAHCLRIAGIIK